MFPDGKNATLSELDRTYKNAVPPVPIGGIESLIKLQTAVFDVINGSFN
jgi:hypothetical protein